MATKKKEPDTLTPQVQNDLHRMFVHAREQRYKFVSVEAMLHGLLDSKELAVFWEKTGVKRGLLQASLVTWMETNQEREAGDAEVDTQPTLGFQRTVQRAIMREMSVKAPVTAASLLQAIFGEKDSFAVSLLAKYGVQRESTLEFSDSSRPRAIVRVPTVQKSAEEKSVEAASLTPITSRRTAQPATPTVFISYSHADTLCLDRLLVHLKPLHRSKAIACWSDRAIRPGAKWREEIRRNLGEARIAILLISADFLASDFIVEDEMPPLLVKAESQGTLIIPVILKPCGYNRDPVLSGFQSINDPSSPLLGLGHIEQEAIYSKIADAVAAELLTIKGN